MNESEIGFSYPPALDFATVNDWVHGDRMFEELQCACLGMATEIEKLRTERLALFAEEVAAAEREACAKVAEGIGQRHDWVPKSLMGNLRRELAAAIRARGAEKLRAEVLNAD